MFNEEAILSVKPYKFKYNIDCETWQYGFMAEDINDAGLPEMCGFDKDGLPDYVAYERFCIAQQQIIRPIRGLPLGLGVGVVKYDIATYELQYSTN